VSAGYKKTLYQACTFLKTECGHLNGGKSKAVTYAFPPGYRENTEEEENAYITAKQNNMVHIFLSTKESPNSILSMLRDQMKIKITLT
jgi:hypothetical protein